ncbi:ABC transporter ATP-binding protein [Nocardia bovistercoris]|uniref:ABC transporter ATP-binding protein n=1 Tax=Nocardia bovistercoris TaxID=2785916 RepID=A0A931N282_9NOCA|nr:ABC transporter ATP-binding protein [Nocardia bovistercoris]MBH0779225.1 ABC transporter ATP-binding protein [Nocardia bovistercoris]
MSLRLSGVTAGYGKLPIVRNLDLEVPSGTVTAVLGPNGAGKTTLMLTIAGLLPALGGEIGVEGKRLPDGRPARANNSGVVLVPDNRALFTGLTVAENLEIARKRGGPSLDEIRETLPALIPRWNVAAGALSGGEQQMLAVGRALVQKPKVLLIDEMSMGLAPVIVENLLPAVRHIADSTGAAIVLVEQHVRLALEVADDAVVLVHGDVTLRGPAAELRGAPERLEAAYLGGESATAAR